MQNLTPTAQRLHTLYRLYDLASLPSNFAYLNTDAFLFYLKESKLYNELEKLAPDLAEKYRKEEEKHYLEGWHRLREILLEEIHNITDPKQPLTGN